MSKKSTPQAPDYQELARQQGAANVETARVEGSINRPDIYTPNGSQVWTKDPNNPDHYILTESYNPQLTDNNNRYNWIQGAALQALGDYGIPAVNSALSQSYGIGGTPQLGWDPNLAPDQRLQTESGMWGAAPIQEGLDFSGAAPIPTADQQTRQTAQDALYARQSQYLDPQFAGKRADLEAKLANQGITAGSEAYNGAMQQLGQEEQQAYSDARMRAIEGGGNEMAQQFGLGLQAHQTGVGDITTQGQFANASRGQLISELLQDMQQRNAAIQGQANIASAQQQSAAGGRQAALAEQAQQYTLPVNILNSLLSSSQVNAPQYQPFNNQIGVQAPPIFQAGQAQDAANMNRYNAQQAGLSNWLNAGSSIGSAFLKSDRRLKSAIRRLGVRFGQAWYGYVIAGRWEQGVMADETPQRFVRRFADGFDRVDYAALARG